MSNLATITNNILADSGIDDINVVVTNGSYANPAWITSLAWTKITGSPANIVTGTGTAGQVPYFNGPSSIASDANFTYNNVTNVFSVNGWVDSYRRFRLYFNDIQTLAAELYEDGASTNGGTLTLYGKASGTVDTVISAAPTKLNYINNAANVMIGWSSDQGYRLAVNGKGYFQDDLRVATDVRVDGKMGIGDAPQSGIALYIKGNSTDSPILKMQGATNTVAMIGDTTTGATDVGKFWLYNAGVETILFSALANEQSFINNSGGTFSVGAISSGGFRFHANGSSWLNGDLQVGSSNVPSVSFRITRTNSSIPADANYFVATANTPNQSWIEGGYFTSELAGVITAPNSGYPYYEVWAGQGSVTNKIFGFVNKTSGTFTSSDLLSVLILSRTGNVSVPNGAFSSKDITINESGSGMLTIIRQSTGFGATVNFRTGGTLNWYLGTRGLVNNNFYIVNEGLGVNNLILDASSGAATFSNSITAASTITVGPIDGSFLRTFGATDGNLRWAFINSSSGIFSIQQQGDGYANQGDRLTINRSGAATFASHVNSGGWFAAPNNFGLTALNAAGSAGRVLIKLNASNQIEIGRDSDISAIRLGTAAANGAVTIASNGSVEFLNRISLGGVGDQTYASLFIGGAITTGTNQYAILTDPQLAGTDNFAVYANARIRANTAVSNAFGVYIQNSERLSGATITNNYGLYIQNQTAGSTINYAIYSAGGTNHFGGVVLLNTTTNQSGYQFQVSGQSLQNGMSIGLRNTAATSTDYPWIFLTDGNAGGIRPSEYGHVFIQSRSTADRGVGIITGSTPGIKVWVTGESDRSNVIIGDANPVNNAAGRGNLTINGSSTAIMNLTTGGVERGYLYHNGTQMEFWNTSNGDIVIGTNNTTMAAFKAAASGQRNFVVGGTTALATASNRGNITINGASNSILSFGINDVLRGYLYNNGTDFFLNSGAGSLTFENNAATAMVISSGGGVGIRTTPGTLQLAVNGSNNGIDFETNTTSTFATSIFYTIRETAVSRTITGGGYSYGPANPLTMILTQTSNTPLGMFYAADDDGPAGLKGFKSRGTVANPVSVNNGDRIFSIEGWAFHGSGPNHAKFGAGMRFVKDDAFGTANTFAPQRTEFYNAVNTTTVQTNMIIFPNGNTTIGSAAYYGSYKLAVEGICASNTGFLLSSGQYNSVAEVPYTGMYMTASASSDGFGALLLASRTDAARPIIFGTFNGTSNGERLRIAASGAITATSSITATAFFESSDSRIKTLLDNNVDYSLIANVGAKYYKKGDIEELGYFAQDFEQILPSAVYKDEKGLLNLSYTQVHTAKIAALEKEVRELKEQLKNK